MPPKLTKAEKAAKKKADKEAKKKAKEALKAKRLKEKEEKKAAKQKLKDDKKTAKKLGITYEEYRKGQDRKALVLKNKAIAEAKKAALEQKQASNDGSDSGSGSGSDSDDDEGGSSVNLLALAGTGRSKGKGKGKGSGSPSSPTTPVAPTPNTNKHPHQMDTPDGYIKSLNLDAAAEEKEEEGLVDTKGKTAKEIAEEKSKMTEEEVKEVKRKKVLFGKKREIAPSPTRQMKNNEKKIKDPLLTRRRKLISHHSYVIDLSIKEKLSVLHDHIKNYEVLLKEAPRDPIIEPKHRKAYQEASRLERELPPPHWGKLNAIGDRIKFFKIKLYLQRLTSLKLFPNNGECPFLGHERDQYDERLDWRCVGLNCSVNSISKIKNIEQFIHLRCLDLSSNHIQTIGTALHTLVELRELNLSNNSIVRMEGLEKCPLLVVLNLKGNNIPKIEGLSNGRKSARKSVLFRYLTDLNLGGNHITRVEHLNALPALTTLDLSRNDLINAEELAFVPQLVNLKIGHNQLEDLVEFGRALVGLNRLINLKVAGNPICTKRDYRLRVLENNSIKMLDDVEIKPRLRTYLKEMQKRAMLEDIMETTTQDYMDRIAVERQVKSDNMDLLRRSELELENAFSKYREEMENELQECISYIHSLDVREDLVERGTLSTVKGMDKWKEKLMAAQLKRDRAKRAYVRKQQAAMLQQTAHTSEALKYTEKLKELADARPGIWREMKRRELMQRSVEQRVQYKQDQTISKRRKLHQQEQKTVREDRERAMLEAVDRIDPQVEAWWNPDAETRDVTVEHLHHHNAAHRDDQQRLGSSAVDGDGDASSDGTISLRSDGSSLGSSANGFSKNSKNFNIQKKKGTTMIHDNDSMTLKVSKKPSAPNAANRYRVKFGPGSMGIKLVDRPEEEETGVYVKGLVEGGKGAMTHKIKVGDLLIRIQNESVTHLNCKQVLEKIRVATRPIQFEFEHVVPKKSKNANMMVAGAVHGSLFSTLFEKGKIGIIWEEDTRPEAGGAIVKEIREGSQAANHKPPVKVGDVLVTIAGEDITPLNLVAINKRINKARRPVRFDFESGEGADLLASAFGDEESSEEEEEEDDKKKKGNIILKKHSKGHALHAATKEHKKKKTVKKAGGLFSWGRKKKNSKKVAPEK